MKKHNVDIHSEVIKMLTEYKSSVSERSKNDILLAILELCEPLIKYSIKQTKYQQPITMEELEQEGKVVIFEIVSKNQYDENKSTKFTTYIINAMIYAMRRYVRENQNVVRIPISRQYKNGKIRTYEKNFEQFHNRKPSRSELLYAGFFGNDIDLCNETRKLNTYLQIDKFDNDETYFNNFDVDEYDDGTKFKNDKLEKAYKELSEKDREFLDKLIECDMSFTEMAKECGCSRQWINEKYHKIVNKLKVIIEKTYE